jgi:hypothetical protein
MARGSNAKPICPGRQRCHARHPVRRPWAAYASASATMLSMSAAELAIVSATKPLSVLSMFFIAATLLAMAHCELGLMLIH